jgi:hypothetical protein
VSCTTKLDSFSRDHRFVFRSQGKFVASHRCDRSVYLKRINFEFVTVFLSSLSKNIKVLFLRKTAPNTENPVCGNIFFLLSRVLFSRIYFLIIEIPIFENIFSQY